MLSFPIPIAILGACLLSMSVTTQVTSLPLNPADNQHSLYPPLSVNRMDDDHLAVLETEIMMSRLYLILQRLENEKVAQLSKVGALNYTNEYPEPADYVSDNEPERETPTKIGESHRVEKNAHKKTEVSPSNAEDFARDVQGDEMSARLPTADMKVNAISNKLPAAIGAQPSGLYSLLEASLLNPAIAEALPLNGEEVVVEGELADSIVEVGKDKVASIPAGEKVYEKLGEIVDDGRTVEVVEDQTVNRKAEDAQFIRELLETSKTNPILEASLQRFEAELPQLEVATKPKEQPKVEDDKNSRRSNSKRLEPANHDSYEDLLDDEFDDLD